MNPVVWGGLVVLLLIVIAVVTMGKTKWKRNGSDQQSTVLPKNQGRASGGDD